MTEESASQPDGTSSGSPSEQDDRDRRIWWSLVAVGFVVFVAVIFWGRPLVAGRLAAARNLDQATATIGETDTQLAEIDAAVRTPSTAGATGENANALALVATTRAKLKDASRLSQDGYDRLTSDEQKRAVTVQAMAEARIAALLAAEAVLSADGEARGEAVQEYERAVKKVQAADEALVKL